MAEQLTWRPTAHRISPLPASTFRFGPSLGLARAEGPVLVDTPGLIICKSLLSTCHSSDGWPWWELRQASWAPPPTIPVSAPVSQITRSAACRPPCSVCANLHAGLGSSSKNNTEWTVCFCCSAALSLTPPPLPCASDTCHRAAGRSFPPTKQ